MTRLRPYAWVGVLLAVSLVFIADARYFTSPPLSGDDWEQFAWRGISHELKVVDLEFNRPFHLAPFALITTLFGIHPQAAYIINFLAIFSASALLYLLVKRAFPAFPWLALPVALISAIYPVVFTRTWLTMTILHIAWLLTLVFLLLLLDYARGGRGWKLALALMILSLSLGIYDMGLGVALLVPLLLAFTMRGISPGRRIALSSPILVVVLYLAWRLVLQPQVFQVQDAYIDKLDLSVLSFLLNLARAFIVFLFSWVKPLLHGLEGSGSLVLNLAQIGIILTFLVCLAAAIRIMCLSGSQPRDESRKTKKSLLRIILLGVAFWIAGFIPVIFIRAPGFDLDTSRDNLYAVAGGSLALAALTAILLQMIAKDPRRLRAALIVIFMPLVVAGVFYQGWMQNEQFKAWEEQKALWNGMLAAAPGLESGTKIILVVPGMAPDRQFALPPFCCNWEARAAVRSLYNDASLKAMYYFIDKPEESGSSLDYDWDWTNVIFIEYDALHRTVHVMDDPAGTLSLPFLLEGYLPRECIITPAPESVLYRGLVK